MGAYYDLKIALQACGIGVKFDIIAPINSLIHLMQIGFVKDCSIPSDILIFESLSLCLG